MYPDIIILKYNMNQYDIFNDIPTSKHARVFQNICILSTPGWLGYSYIYIWLYGYWWLYALLMAWWLYITIWDSYSNQCITIYIYIIIMFIIIIIIIIIIIDNHITISYKHHVYHDTFHFFVINGTHGARSSHSPLCSEGHKRPDGPQPAWARRGKSLEMAGTEAQSQFLVGWLYKIYMDIYG